MNSSPIIDCNYSREAALRGSVAPTEILALQVLVDVDYWSFDSQLHRGQIVVHHDVAEEVRAIFDALLEAKFPLQKVIPVVAYAWSDDASMADNNSSGFNYRPIVGENPATARLSRHSLGLAIDLNPLQNPYLKDDLILPPHAIYDPKQAGTIVSGDVVTQTFAAHGWDWGGAWTRLLDYQHFEK